MNKILKMFIPSSKKLAGYAAEGLQRCINSSQKEAEIAKWSQLADKFTEYQAFVTRILTDGKISDDEKDEIAVKLEPLMAYLKELI